METGRGKREDGEGVAKGGGVSPLWSRRVSEVQLGPHHFAEYTRHAASTLVLASLARASPLLNWIVPSCKQLFVTFSDLHLLDTVFCARCDS